jgi:phytanoyl-CoA hydroxylase
VKSDDYFLKSAGNISYFFEEKAFDDKGELRQSKALSINKIGHGEHINLSHEEIWAIGKC